jgi:hypothetical protein
MHNFKNQNIQELYNYLIEEFSWNDLYYDEDNTIKKIKYFIDKLNTKDWIDFELSINQWDSRILYALANITTHDNSPKYPYEKIYCLAFVYCDITDSYELLNGLSTELNPNKKLDEDLLIKVIDKANSFWDGHQEAHIEFTKKLLNKKLKLAKD